MGHSVEEYMVCLVSNVQTLAEEKGKGCNAVKSAPSSHLWTVLAATTTTATEKNVSSFTYYALGKTEKKEH